MPVDKVHFHIDFFRGVTNTAYFKDFATFDVQNNPQDRLHFSRITNFAKTVLKGETLIGRNVENDGSYSDYDTWHYHCGPWANVSSATSTKIDQENPLGATSGPAIHYTWQGNLNEIVIIGFSPEKHDNPFPQLNFPDNPLRDRLKVDDELYDESELEDLTPIFNT
ncbi:hypothetical protein R7070_16585 [Vibrio sp. 1557]|uniref:hypothetical protein n=1 Tax=Vibrio sp. 1557 TaxID=3074561 RepID=UPI0029651D82|nr:hypothetical protein [Vibrio sp. 1557]MDW2264383.1 hypothetical protein [Vibrio sp. 1557]